MGQIRDIVDYTPPTKAQLERRAYIRGLIEHLEVRPLRDTIQLDDNIRRVRVSDRSGLIAVICLTAAFALSLAWGLL
jgi:hypothetical protein